MDQLVWVSIFVVILTTFILYILRKRAKFTSIHNKCNTYHHTKKNNPTSKSTTITTATTRTKKVAKVCPFSKNSNFIVEVADHVEPSPLELFEDWIDENVLNNNNNHNNQTVNHNFSNDDDVVVGKPLAARWLNAGLSGQDTPGTLRAGLKRLRDSKYFLVEDRHRIKHELLLKQKALDDPDRYPLVFVSEPESLEAQRECLELFLDYLPRRYPDMYVYHSSSNSITVKPIETTFFIKDYWDTNPLELCERMVQEDLVLMRPAADNDNNDDTVSDTTRKIQPYVMSAAAVVFSFVDLQQKLGKPTDFIHAPVPGFAKDLRKTLDLTFSTLRSERPLWRNNWNLSPDGNLDDPSFGFLDNNTPKEDTTHNGLGMDVDMDMDVDITVEEVKTKFLDVEYQTIRRLPRTKYLLFTVKTLIDPITSLENLPVAAKCLASSIRGMSPNMRKYKGIENDKICHAILSYLDSITTTEK